MKPLHKLRTLYLAHNAEIFLHGGASSKLLSAFAATHLQIRIPFKALMQNHIKAALDVVKAHYEEDDRGISMACIHVNSYVQTGVEAAPIALALHTTSTNLLKSLSIVDSSIKLEGVRLLFQIPHDKTLLPQRNRVEAQRKAKYICSR